jgi:exodeoxyribonuclease VIII
MDTYHTNTKRIGKSGLDLIARSPAHYWAKYLDPKRKFEEPTQALLDGSFVHTAVLENHLLSQRFAVLPKIDRRTNAGKEEWNTFLTFNKGRQFVTQETWDMGLAVAESLYKHPTASKLLSTDGEVESPIEWTMPVTISDGSSVMVPCKAKPDKLLVNHVILDLKTTDNAHPAIFGRSAHKYRYPVQAAWYTDGHYYAKGHYPEAFIFICVEKESPYCVSVLFADNTVLEHGRKLYQKDLAVYAECLKFNQWHGYPTDVMPLSLPAYALNETN